MFVEIQVDPLSIQEDSEMARPSTTFISVIWFILRVMAVLGAIKLTYLFTALI